MSFFKKVQQLQQTLTSKGFVTEAQLLDKVAHYVPEDIDGVPSFWRRNLDYGEGFYYGDMSEKPGVKEWLAKHKGKGPNMPKTKKEACDKIPGGLADKKTDKDFSKKQLEMGEKVEMEHTDDPDLAREIARDHLEEHPDEYYTALKQMEKKLEKKKKKGRSDPAIITQSFLDEGDVEFLIEE